MMKRQLTTHWWRLLFVLTTRVHAALLTLVVLPVLVLPVPSTMAATLLDDRDRSLSAEALFRAISLDPDTFALAGYIPGHGFVIVAALDGEDSKAMNEGAVRAAMYAVAVEPPAGLSPDDRFSIWLRTADASYSFNVSANSWMQVNRGELDFVTFTYQADWYVNGTRIALSRDDIDNIASLTASSLLARAREAEATYNPNAWLNKHLDALGRAELYYRVSATIVPGSPALNGLQLVVSKQRAWQFYEQAKSEQNKAPLVAAAMAKVATHLNPDHKDAQKLYDSIVRRLSHDELTLLARYDVESIVSGQALIDLQLQQHKQAISTALNPGTPVLFDEWQVAPTGRVEFLRRIGRGAFTRDSDDGFIFALVEVETTNTGRETGSFGPFVFWELRDQLDKTYHTEIAAASYISNPLDVGQVPPGASRRGFLVFQVDERATMLELELQTIRQQARWRVWSADKR